MLFLSACGPTEDELNATDTKIAAEVFATQTAAAPTATDTFTPSPTSTNTPKPTKNRTATAESLATKQAESMANLVQQLYNDGHIQSTQGEYFRIPDFQESFAQINYVRPYFMSDITTSDFVLRSNIAWKTAKEGANIKNSGCGIWFGVDEEVDNFHEVFLSLDGNVRLARCLNGCRSLSHLASNYFGKVDYLDGDAEIILAVEGGTIQTFVNGELIFTRQNQKELTGFFAFAISSGTNADFGTRCTFSDNEIWNLEE